MTNTMTDDRERLLNGDWIVYHVVEDEKFDLWGSRTAILTEKQREKMDGYDVELVSWEIFVHSKKYRTISMSALDLHQLSAGSELSRWSRRHVPLTTATALERPRMSARLNGCMPRSAGLLWNAIFLARRSRKNERPGQSPAR